MGSILVTNNNNNNNNNNYNEKTATADSVNNMTIDHITSACPVLAKEQYTYKAT
jgi:hypothetical protein